MCKAFGGVCALFLAAFLAKFMVHAAWPPAKSGGHQRLQRTTGVPIYRSFFFPASLCQRVPPHKGGHPCMAPTTGRTTRGCVLKGSLLWSGPCIPSLPFVFLFFSLGHGGMGSAFGLVDLSTAPARSKCIQVRGLSFEPRINK